MKKSILVSTLVALTVSAPLAAIDDVFVKTLTAKIIKVSKVSGDNSVCWLKHQIRNIEGYKGSQQRLIFKGKQLDNASKLSDYGIKHEDTLHLVLRLGGDRNAKSCYEESGYKGK